MSKPTAAVYFDTRRQNSKGQCPIRIRITNNREQRFYSTGISMDRETWSRLQLYLLNPNDGRKKDDALKALFKVLYDFTTKSQNGKLTEEPGHLKRAQTIIDNLSIKFTFDAFRNLWNAKSTKQREDDSTDVLACLKRKEESMLAQGRIGNGQNYGNAARSLLRFVTSLSAKERQRLNLPTVARKKNDSTVPVLLHFEHITPQFLEMYEDWMLHSGNAPRSATGVAKAASITTVGIYLRHLRAVFNEAITLKIIPASIYPFMKGGYTIPAGTNPKKALDKEAVLKILAYNSIDPTGFEQRSKDFWTLSYLTNGANFSDLFTLRWHNIDLKAKTVSFVRNKTARTRKANQQVITARLFDESIAIIKRWANTDQSSNSYVFPFINDDMNDLRKKAILKQLIKVTNKWMERIAQKLEIEGEISTYAARHSFATILLRSNAPLAFISQSLGHTNLKTTQNYLGSFTDDQTDEFLSALL